MSKHEQFPKIVPQPVEPGMKRVIYEGGQYKDETGQAVSVIIGGDHIVVGNDAFDVPSDKVIPVSLNEQ